MKKLPRKRRTREHVIADLSIWVKMGAPWPNDQGIKKTAYADFDLHKRKKEHWSWQPIQAPAHRGRKASRA